MSFAYNPQSTGDEITAAKFNAVTAALGRINGVQLSPLNTGTYVIFQVSTTYYRRNIVTGQVDDSNASLTVLSQDANDALTSGGTIIMHELELPGAVTLSDDVLVLEHFEGKHLPHSNQGKFIPCPILTVDPATVGWGASQEPYWWYNDTIHKYKFWDGSSVQTMPSVGGGTTYKLFPYYTCYRTGANYYAMDEDGNVDYSGADADTVINAALTAVNAAGGGSVRLKAGTYIIDNMIDMLDYTSLIGEGYGTLIQVDANVIVSGSNFGAVRVNGVNDWYVGYLRINGNQANNAGSLPHASADEGDGLWITNGSYNGLVEQIEVFNCMERGVRISHGAPYNNRMQFCYAHDNGMLGVMNGDGFMYGASGYRNSMHHCLAKNSWKDNFIFFNQDRSIISNNLSYDPGQIGAGGGGTHYALDGTATFNLLMHNYGYNTNAAQSVGILVGATANFNSVIGNVIEAGSLYGIDVRGDYNTIGGNVVKDMDYTGFRFLNATYNTIWGNYSLDNNQSAQVALESGFYFNNSDYNLIGYNWGVDTGGATQLYGFNFNAASANNYIGFNGATGNTTSDWQVTGSNPQMFFNVGYVNFNRGAAANVNDGGNIAHGLSGTPTNVRCTCSVATEIISVSALGAANFTVAIKTPAGAAGTQQTIYWDAWL